MNQVSKNESRSSEQRLAWRTLQESTTARMAALMGGHEWLHWPGDFGKVFWPGARTREGQSQHAYRRRKGSAGFPATSKGAAQLARAAKLQDQLLDQGLAETFPASDPVSISRVS